MGTISKYYHTLKDLKWKQVKYQLLKRFTHRPYKALEFRNTPIFLNYTDAHAYSSFTSLGQCFIFLNLKHAFPDEIDWHFSQHGKLWNYNLHYFDYLNQADISKEDGLKLIHSWMKTPILEPYPTSLRLNNWIRFVSKHKIESPEILNSIYSQANYLLRNIEYHLLGNHLLENGFALLTAGMFLSETTLNRKGEEIISEEIKEQILPDGGHFELSPMYHNIVLNRVLETLGNIDLNKKNDAYPQLGELLKETASRMLSWINNMEFQDGTLPRVNDTTGGIAPPAKYLRKVAKHLGIKPSHRSLKESGYRKLEVRKAELLVDVGQIGPNYIPGHAHSDTFNFILHIIQRPFIVDTGISTYEKNERRIDERSTAAHNTVLVGEEEQSEVWGGFRVARKAGIVSLQEEGGRISASHNGYEKIGCIHERSFSLAEEELVVHDKLTEGFQATAYLHFHPSAKIRIEASVIYSEYGYINFENEIRVVLQKYEYAHGFNKTEPALRAVVTFVNALTTRITF